MQTGLWELVAAFNLDNPPGEYSFSIRLAGENQWTLQYTEQAILEYKRFMYMAAVTDTMVSPSAIVDIVWHQHLLYTRSYNDFCELLGRQIQHIPSTRSEEDYSKFQAARVHTLEFYKKTFDRPPPAIWHCKSMYDGLPLRKSRFSLQTLIISGITAVLCLIVPFYYALHLFYRHISNPYFVTGLLTLTGLVWLLLEGYNRYRLQRLFLKATPDSFFYDLEAIEIIYLKTRQLQAVINTYINDMVRSGALRINRDNSIETGSGLTDTRNAYVHISHVVAAAGTITYSNLINTLITKPVFRNIANSMNAFRKYVTGSQTFIRLFLINFTVGGILLLLATTRILTGIINDKPVTYIIAATLVIAVSCVLMLLRLTHRLFSFTINRAYLHFIVPGRLPRQDNAQQYLLNNSAAWSLAFLTLIQKQPQRGTDSGDAGVACGHYNDDACNSCGGCGSD